MRSNKCRTRRMLFVFVHIFLSGIYSFWLWCFSVTSAVTLFVERGCLFCLWFCCCFLSEIARELFPCLFKCQWSWAQNVEPQTGESVVLNAREWHISSLPFSLCHLPTTCQDCSPDCWCRSCHCFPDTWSCYFLYATPIQYTSYQCVTCLSALTIGFVYLDCVISFTVWRVSAFKIFILSSILQSVTLSP